MALLDTQVAMLANLGANYLVSGNVPGRMGNAHQNIVPYQVFEVAPASDGHHLEGATGAARDHIIIAVGNDSQFRKYCEVASVPELGVNPLFALNRDRVKNRAQLVPILEAVMRTRRKADWLAALEAAKVPCGAINNLAEVFADPHIAARDMVTHWQHPHQSDLRLVSSPIKLSATPVRTPDSGGLPPPLLGQHTDEVLRSVLNYQEAKLSDLKDQKVI
jgi:crotonobetainyl-CoA:carnitine CoA-transferase CaiB-like acyl-CoA transferase